MSTTVQAKLDALVAGEDAADLQTIAVALCHQLFELLSGAVGHPIALDRDSVLATDDAVTAHGGATLTSGQPMAPFARADSILLPITLRALLSIDLHRLEGPSVIAILFVEAAGVRVAPREHDHLWYEWTGELSRWRCGGWERDVYDELV
jgi:hypothetical protein